MRPDQVARLEKLVEQLADRFLLEADPTMWPGQPGLPPAQWTEQERGDAWWCKKNAMGTGGVLKFGTDVLAKAKERAAGDPDADADADLDRMVREAQRRAGKAVEDALERAKRKPEFDKRVAGR